MRKLVICTLLVFAMSGLVLAQTTTTTSTSSTTKPYAPGYVRIRHQPINTTTSTVSSSSDPTLGPTDNESNGNSIVGNPGGLPGVLSVPNFTKSFTAYSTTYPYTMIGNDPTLGHTTSLPVNILPVAVQLLKADGTILETVTPDQYMTRTVNSPNFANIAFADGKGQFADAVQRAEFYNTMKQNWHTNLNPPTVLPEVTVQIPATVTVNIGGTNYNVATYRTDTAPDGEPVVLLLNLYFDEVVFPNIVNNQINLGNFDLNGINITFFPNTYLFQVDSTGNFSNCCTLGYHTFFSDTSVSPETRWITIFASWVAPSYFNSNYADVTAFSHEISEALNDPFINNVVPKWQYPNNSAECQNNLETGDPLEYTSNPTYAIDLKVNSTDVIFHPQNEALLQWFEQITTSDAYDHTYSYPYETALIGPATLCP